MMEDGDLTPALESAIAVYELFRNYVAAGFTEDQAFHLITDITIALIQINGFPES